MTDPPDNHRESVRGSPIELDRQIVNGSILAIAAFAIVLIGVAWYALTGHRPTTASIKPPAFERSMPDNTTGYSGARPMAPAPNPPAR
jgi:hypothetical protein